MAEENRQPKKLSWKKNVMLYLHDVIIYLIIICIVFLLVFRVVVVSGTSMNMTLLDGDYLLLVSNLFYGSPDRGDVIVVSKQSFDNGKPIVKRVIATEGQTVDIKEGAVYVDGEIISEAYLTPGLTTHNSGGVQFPLTVSDGCVFVLGDNRSNSRDSRYPEIGLIDEREILGKAILLFLPGTNGTNPDGSPKIPRDYSRIGAIE